MKKIILICFSVFLLHANAAEKVTPSKVYSEVIQIQKELLIIKKYFKIKKIIDIQEINTTLKPRHAWQKTYEIMIKLNILRSSSGMPIIEPSNMPPVLNLDPILTYEQTQRILSEIKIFKFRKNIKKEVSLQKTYKNKTPLDVYNALHKASKLLDIINGSEFTPSYVFGETMRIFDDITALLIHLNVKDDTIPTKRVYNSTPIDTFSVGIKILQKIETLQKSYGIETINFHNFKKKVITPSDVFSLSQIILAELQTIKASAGLTEYITLPSKKYEHKTPSDVEQMMGWSLRQISLIKNEIK